MKEQKTNVMRILDQKKIPYIHLTYSHGEEAVDGLTVAQELRLEPEYVFKTLVTRGASGNYYVFVVPVCGELDLKKAAHAVGEKSVAMIPVKELLPLTGYVRGGCSPVGMKKLFHTVIDLSAVKCEAIAVSAGKIGDQILIDPYVLCELVKGQFVSVVSD